MVLLMLTKMCVGCEPTVLMFAEVIALGFHVAHDENLG
jgi:hypothetical protein